MAKTKNKVIVNFEVTPEQREQIQEHAAWFSMSMAEFLRHRALEVGLPGKKSVAA